MVNIFIHLYPPSESDWPIFIPIQYIAACGANINYYLWAYIYNDLNIKRWTRGRLGMWLARAP